MRFPSRHRYAWRWLSACVLTMLAACGDAPTAVPASFAYDPASLTGGQLYRWSSGTTVKVWVVPPLAGTGVDLASATRVGIAAWNAVPKPSRLSLELASTIHDAQVIVYDRGSTLPVVTSGNCEYDARNAGGYTYICPSGGRALIFPLSTGGSSVTSVVIRIDAGRFAQAQLDAVVTHELGHAIGIGGHSSDALDVMFGLPTVSTPSARDRQTLQWLLGQAPAVTL
jgi:hypothetical protein